MTTASEGSSQLFHGSLPVTLLQPNRNGPEYISSVVDVVLKLIERRFEGNEKEYRVEISRPDEFEFLYAEGITRIKYQSLAKTWNLNVDFDDFPARIVRLLRERKGTTSPVQLTCTLSQDLSVCTFEVVHLIDMYTVRMPIELKAVRGKDLLCHVTNNMRALQAQASTLKTEKKKLEQDCEELRHVVEELREFRVKAELENSQLEQRLKEAEKRLADEKLKREEFEQDLQLERDERDSALNTIENLKEDLAEAEKKARDLEEELDQCEEECEDLNSRLQDSEAVISRLRCDKENLATSLDKTKKDLAKANHVIAKYLKGEMRGASERSLDERKNEMAADLKMKESLIDEMTASIADYKKKVDDLTKENKELHDTLQILEAEQARNARVIEMYRNQQRAVASRSLGTSPIIPGFGPSTTLFGGRTSPLGGFAPSTPTNFRNVLGKPLQASTALVTPSMRGTPPALNLRYANAALGRENLSPANVAIEAAQPQTTASK
ncbi:hypothetical protein Y032_0040g171 [Ancylostoma ceylanicum]|uniref:Spindle assembly abnormal protein 6 N-terminal domain-containing protein n=1 Tax=Ancylostoma ceylanicum TaxID=53326 RepID=A0A016UGA8_9BILA|nr:hypothetical protein Y032_0040g171 [Ancylostoma ceylanicum]